MNCNRDGSYSYSCLAREFHDAYNGDGIPRRWFLGDLNASVPVHHHLRRFGRQVESIFVEIHSRVEQEAVVRGNEASREKERLANRAPGATNRISESRR